MGAPSTRKEAARRRELIAQLKELAKAVKRVDEIADEIERDQQAWEVPRRRLRVAVQVGTFSWGVVEDADDLLAVLAFAEDRWRAREARGATVGVATNETMDDVLKLEVGRHIRCGVDMGGGGSREILRQLRETLS